MEVYQDIWNTHVLNRWRCIRTSLAWWSELTKLPTAAHRTWPLWSLFSRRAILICLLHRVVEEEIGSRSWALLWKREGVYNWVGCCLRWVGLGPDLESSRPWPPPAPLPPDKPQNCELADAITFRKDATPSWQERLLWLIYLFTISFSFWWFLRPDFTILTTFLFSHNFISLPGSFSSLISYLWPTMRGKRWTRE